MISKKSIRQVREGPHAGKWAQFLRSGKGPKGRFYVGTVRETAGDAYAAALFLEGHTLLARLRPIQKTLEAIGAVDANDPYGWRA